MKKEIEPNPGSEEAQSKGCTCPIIDNHFGKGRPVGNEIHFIFSSDCPLHGEIKS